MYPLCCVTARTLDNSNNSVPVWRQTLMIDTVPHGLVQMPAQIGLHHLWVWVLDSSIDVPYSLTGAVHSRLRNRGGPEMATSTPLCAKEWVSDHTWR